MSNDRRPVEQAQPESPFDSIRKATPEGREFWSARRKLGLPSIDPQQVTA